MKEERASVFSISSKEAQFDLTELFFSRTDPRGVVLSGNEVFQRVSGYEWDKLLNAPHKIVRHDDMPKAVFWLFWNELKIGRPIGAYVKNRALDGSFYWVFAVAMPIEGGYLSIRLKPTSDLLNEVIDVYERIRKTERDDPKNVSAENSAKDLLKALRKKGFVSYTAFMSAALAKELNAKDTTLGREKDAPLLSFCSMSDAVQKIYDEAQNLYEDFKRIELIPVNLRLQATRSGATSGPVRVISENYSGLAKEALDFGGRFAEFAKDVFEQINLGLFLMGAARLQREMGQVFETEDHTGTPIDHVQETVFLDNHRVYCGRLAQQTVSKIHEQARGFIEDSRRMRRFVSGLDVTRVSCRIETGSIIDGDGGFRAIIAKLDAFHVDVEKRLRSIDDLNDCILSQSEDLMERSSKHA